MEKNNSLMDIHFDAPQFTFYEVRIGTFAIWPVQIVPDKYSLAKAGFYYTGKGDLVKCFACGTHLNHWQTTDTPLAEHKKWPRDCLFLNMIGYDEPQIDTDIWCFSDVKHSLPVTSKGITEFNYQ